MIIAHKVGSRINNGYVALLLREQIRGPSTEKDSFTLALAKLQVWLMNVQAIKLVAVRLINVVSQDSMNVPLTPIQR